MFDFLLRLDLLTFTDAIHRAIRSLTHSLPPDQKPSCGTTKRRRGRAAPTGIRRHPRTTHKQNPGEVASQIIGVIERHEGQSFKRLGRDVIQQYAQVLSTLLQKRLREELGYDARRGQRLL